MPAPPPSFYPLNAFEAAIVTMTPDGPDSGADEARLTDRDIGLEVPDMDVAGERVWHYDLGIGTLPAVDAFLFAGSGYAGELVTLESSPDNSTWSPRGTVTPASDTPQRVTFASLTAPRYWRVTVTDPAVPVRFSEHVLSAAVEFTYKPEVPSLREPPLLNVDLVQSFGGRAWGLERGARRWSSTYAMGGAPEADRVKLLAMLETLQSGALPFFLWTVVSELRWVRVTGCEIEASEKALSAWDLTVQLTEEL